MILGSFPHDPGSGLAGILFAVGVLEMLFICCGHVIDLLLGAAGITRRLKHLTASWTPPSNRLTANFVRHYEIGYFHAHSFPQAGE
jgi:hypothetical protein